MFPRIALWCVIAAAGLILLDFCLLRFRRVAAAGGATRWWEKLLYAVTFLAFLALAGTGFLPTISPQWPMHRWVLMTHCSAAPVFAIGIALIAMLWADYARLGRQAGPFDRAQKTIFWLASLGALAVIVSALGGFMPWFGTGGKVLLLQVHRYAALGLAIVMVGQIYLFTLGRARLQGNVDQKTLARSEIGW